MGGRRLLCCPKVALHLRRLTIEIFQNYETVKGECIPSKNKLKTQKAIS